MTDVRLAVDYTLPDGTNGKAGSRHKVDFTTARNLAHDGIVSIVDEKAAALPSAQTPAGNPPAAETDKKKG